MSEQVTVTLPDGSQKQVARGTSIADFVRAILETGFRGWFSVEVFDGQFEKKYGDDLRKYAEKAKETNTRLVNEAAALESL